MILVVLILGIILCVVAIRGTQGALFSALKQDVPAFGIWAAAVIAIGAIGFVPGLKPVSRGLLGLIILVIVINNYQNIIKGFQSVSLSSAASSGSTSSGSGSSSSSLGSIISGINNFSSAINPGANAASSLISAATG